MPGSIFYVLKLLAKNVFIPLGLTAAMSATDAAMERNIFGLEIISNESNEETDDIIKIIKSLEDSGLLLKSVSKTIKLK